MTLWLDAQLSPGLARWIGEAGGVSCIPVRDVGLRDATDRQIFEAAGRAGAVLVTKDADFVQLLERLGAPPQVVWVTCGNTSNLALRQLLTLVWPHVRGLLDDGEALVEVREASP